MNYESLLRNSLLLEIVALVATLICFGIEYLAVIYVGAKWSLEANILILAMFQIIIVVGIIALILNGGESQIRDTSWEKCG